MIFACSLRCSDNAPEIKEVNIWGKDGKKLWEQDYIEKYPCETQNKRIFIKDLVGDRALVFITALVNGPARVKMIHYQRNWSSLIPQLEQDAKESRLERERIREEKLIFVVPQEWAQVDGDYRPVLKSVDGEGPMSHFWVDGKLSHNLPVSSSDFFSIKEVAKKLDIPPSRVMLFTYMDFQKIFTLMRRSISEVASKENPDLEVELQGDKIIVSCFADYNVRHEI